MYLPMMNQIRPEILAICQRAIEDSQTFAEKWLSQGMLHDDPEHAKEVAVWLSTGEKYKSHGKVIDFQEARDVLRLNVEKIDNKSKLWSNIWELYCRQTQHLQFSGAAKLFENDTVSLNLNINFHAGVPPPAQGQPPAQLIEVPQIQPQRLPKEKPEKKTA